MAGKAGGSGLTSLPGVGAATAKKLKAAKLGTVAKLAKASLGDLKKAGLSAGVATKVLAAAKAATATKETVKKTTGKAASAAKKAASKAKSTSKQAATAPKAAAKKPAARVGVGADNKCCDVNNCDYDLTGTFLRAAYGPNGSDARVAPQDRRAAPAAEGRAGQGGPHGGGGG